MDGMRIDKATVQALRETCERAFKGKTVGEVAGVLELLTADFVCNLHGATEHGALGGADALARDIQNIIRGRFAAQAGRH